MASRMFNQFGAALEKGVVTLFARITIGATGAVGTLDLTKNIGIYSVTRTSTGLYVINFGQNAANKDKYKRVLALAGCCLQSNAAIMSINLAADNATTGSISINTSSATATLADPDNGAVLLIEIRLKNASI